jgi:putative endonuclease
MLAATLLRLKFYRILGRRVRTHAGEIDLVARSPSGVLCFIEVKARKHDRAALESVAPRQRARIARAAALFVAGKEKLALRGMRFDIITVAPFPRHFRDAWRP